MGWRRSPAHWQWIATSHSYLLRPTAYRYLESPERGLSWVGGKRKVPGGLGTTVDNVFMQPFYNAPSSRRDPVDQEHHRLDPFKSSQCPNSILCLLLLGLHQQRNRPLLPELGQYVVEQRRWICALQNRVRDGPA